MLFRLRSQGSGMGTATVSLKPGKTMGGYLWIFTQSLVTNHNKFTGTVEYEGRPGQSWDFKNVDPTALYMINDPTSLTLNPNLIGRKYFEGHVRVRLGPDDVQTFEFFRPYGDP